MPPVRRYRGVMSDSARWERFTFRPGDVVISTPSKCGTTWMQTIVGMLLLDRVDLGAPISTLSPWLDMLIRTDDEVFGLLDRQTHRRFIKTHTPLDGLPQHDEVTYIALIRHPLDVAPRSKVNRVGDRRFAARLSGFSKVERIVGLLCLGRMKLLACVGSIGREERVEQSIEGGEVFFPLDEQRAQRRMHVFTRVHVDVLQRLCRIDQPAGIDEQARRTQQPPECDQVVKDERHVTCVRSVRRGHFRVPLRCLPGL